VAYLGLAANLFIIVGLMILLESQTNPFGDPLVLVLLLLNQILLFLLERLCLLLRRCLRLWEVQPSAPPLPKKDSRLAKLPTARSIKSSTTTDHGLQLRGLKG
jgi:hypothetical protein